MGLNIFTFDLAAIIDSFSYLFNSPAGNNQETPVVSPEKILPLTEENSSLAAIDSMTDKILLAATAALNNAANITPDEILQKASSKTEKSVSQPTALNTSAAAPQSKELQEFIKLLQTTVVHSYKNSDFVGGNVSLNTVNNFFKKDARASLEEDSAVNQAETRRKERLKLDELRAELKKARLKNNVGVANEKFSR